MRQGDTIGAMSGLRLSVARAGLEAMRRHGLVGVRYGYYRMRGDEEFRWGNFTGRGPDVEVVYAVEPTKANTASKPALIRALLASVAVTQP